MATTVADLIQQVLHHIPRPQRNKLSGALTDSSASVVCEFDLSGLTAGTTITVDLEEMHVWSVNTSTKTATVERGANGTVAATHADDSIVWVNPTASPFRILKAANEELMELPPDGVYQPKTDTFTFDAAVNGYDLVADVIDVIDVAYNLPDTSQLWVPVQRRGWRFNPNADPADFPSGKSLTLIEGGYPGQTVQVTYKAAFVALAALADNVASVSKLPARAHAILEYGAAVRVTPGLALRRADLASQGSTRRAGETSTSDVLRSPARLESLYLKAVRAESEYLKGQYGL